MDLNDLPLETFLEILKNTDGCTLARCREVCKQWKDVIDNTDLLWQHFCDKDFKSSSKIAKKKSGHECQWYHIYKNLKKWSKVFQGEKKFKDFYKFTVHDKYHALGIDSNILPLRNTKGFVLYDMSTLKYIPVALPERNCLKLSNNDNVTIILTKTGLYLQRTVTDKNYQTEAFLKCDDFVLAKDFLYYYNNRDIYKSNLLTEEISPKLIQHSEYDIKEMQVTKNCIYLFTDCGKIVTIKEEKSVKVKPINIPVEWIKQIKHIHAFDDKNFVCYSQTVFKIETDKYQHLYLDFPSITALFFYGDIVVIGTRKGEILIYRLSSQKRALKPIFEIVTVLPEDKVAVQLDVCERKTGPVIVVATFFEILLIEFEYFPHEEQTKKTFTTEKLHMYKRLLKLKQRLQT